jgi:hypothetical protein
MKWSAYLLFTLVVVACDPYNFGFKLNPAKILNEAFVAIKDEDKDAFLRVSGKEALCIYGNDQGMAYLRNHANIDIDDIKLKLNLLKETSFEIPEYVGYWSYLSQRFQMDVLDRDSNETLIKAIVDCHYGVDGEKSPSYIKLKREKYKRKECKLIKIIPITFEPLKLPKRCNILKVVL